MLSHKLVALAFDGVTDPQELRKLALTTFPGGMWDAATSKCSAATPD
jgi:hypothetical protein